MIKERILRTGDGTHKYSKIEAKNADIEATLENNNNNSNPERDTEHFWGWGKCYLIILT